MFNHAIKNAHIPMGIKVVNLKGSTAKRNWAADIIQGDQFTHRLISASTPGGHRVIIRNDNGQIVAEHTSPQPISVDDIISWANSALGNR